MTGNDVTSLLRRAIRRRVLAPGEVLVQEEIASRLGVSRIPLREALRGLAAVGIVEMQPGRGFRVTSLDAAEVAELYDLRLRIEPTVAESIVANTTTPVLRELERLERQMRATDDAEEWANLNYDFHMRMYESMGLPHTCRIVRQLLDLVEPYSRLYVHELHNLDRVEHEHTAMVDAIRSGDAERVSMLIAAHLEGARDGLVKAMNGHIEEDLVARLVGATDRASSTRAKPKTTTKRTGGRNRR